MLFSFLIFAHCLLSRRSNHQMMMDQTKIEEQVIIGHRQRRISTRHTQHIYLWWRLPISSSHQTTFGPVFIISIFFFIFRIHFVIHVHFTWAHFIVHFASLTNALLFCHGKRRIYRFPGGDFYSFLFVYFSDCFSSVHKWKHCGQSMNWFIICFVCHCENGSEDKMMENVWEKNSSIAFLGCILCWHRLDCVASPMAVTLFCCHQNVDPKRRVKSLIECLRMS